MAKKEKKEIQGPPTVAGWLGTYGDMVTLILCFFVLLFSFSTMDAAKWQELVQSFKGDIPSYITEHQPPGRIPAVPNPILVGSAQDDDPLATFDKAWEELFSDVGDYIKKLQESDVYPSDESFAEFEMTDLEIRIPLPSSMLFDSGRYLLKPDVIPILNELMVDEILPNLDLIKLITIEGHTDNVPVLSASYRDNFELSYWRADSVRRAIIDFSEKIPPQFVESLARGEYFPVHDPDNAYNGDLQDEVAYYDWVREQNATSEQRTRNRRCVLVLKRDVEIQAVVPGENTTENP
jgi:chemotaxis protein MotB